MSYLNTSASPLAGSGLYSGYQSTTIERLIEIGLNESEAEAFRRIQERYIRNRREQRDQRLDKLGVPDDKLFAQYESLPDCPPEQIPVLLNKLVVIKLNGGLGTSLMGSSTALPKSLIELQPDNTFLDVVVRQVEYLNNTFNVQVPLVLMNSFATDKATQKVLRKYENRNVKIYTFVQTSYPRLFKDTLQPIAKGATQRDSKDWAPAGSGDVFESFHRTGLLEKFLNEGKEYAFISNVENIGGSVGTRTFRLINEVFKSQHEFLIEVTERTPTDHLGGVLVQDCERSNRIRSLELSQVPKEKLHLFKPNKFRYWNTNSMWVSMGSLLTHIKQDQLKLSIISKHRNEDGRGSLQLEQPAGGAIQCFQRVEALVVPRHRFREVKTTADLFVLQSNLFKMEDNGLVTINPARGFNSVPVIKFGNDRFFATLSEYKKRFKGKVPNLIELDHLTASGDVVFGSDVTLKGTVIIVANDGEHLDIPDGAILENKVVSGSFYILEH
eukprot:TRINITY_DN2506_c0_g2_i1.p1 TRINITY_DN2506_c0_g2~~TRINITY_DN2506_c0_g2_i1.p1  ORF type:complete len:498 (+),score=130.22 TRINITY_DN2506_c0_g2_i1:156-1649(+)